MTIKILHPSRQYEFNKEDIIKILKGAGIASAGALLTYVTDIIPLINWGEFKPIIVVISSIGINALWKLLQGQ